MDDKVKQYDWTPDGMREPPKYMGAGDWVMEEDYLAVRKIVDTLPTTADGNPIHFLENYWYIRADEEDGTRKVVGCGIESITIEPIDSDYQDWEIEILDEDGFEEVLGPERLFSTAEAAEVHLTTLRK